MNKNLDFPIVHSYSFQVSVIVYVKQYTTRDLHFILLRGETQTLENSTDSIFLFINQSHCC